MGQRWFSWRIALCCLTVSGWSLAARQVTAGDFTVVVLPDTQFYAQDAPAIYNAMTQWIVDKQQSRNIAFVAHVGDPQSANRLRREKARIQLPIGESGRLDRNSAATSPGFP